MSKITLKNCLFIKFPFYFFNKNVFELKLLLSQIIKLLVSLKPELEPEPRKPWQMEVFYTFYTIGTYSHLVPAGGDRAGAHNGRPGRVATHFTSHNIA